MLLAGVGGQGVLSAARFLGEAAAAAETPAVVGQLHGMSQRGGTVRSTVLFGPFLSSHLGVEGADVLVAFEPLEALRARFAVRPHTTVIVSRGVIMPMSLAARGAEYPSVDGILGELERASARVVALDGPALVAEAGDPRTLNVVMLGALARIGALPFDAALLLRSIERHLPARYLSPNRRAFSLGMESVTT